MPGIISLMDKSIVLLGSTGSIGCQTLDVARTHNIKIKALAAKSNITLLSKQAAEFRPEYIAVYDIEKYTELKDTLSGSGIKLLCGMDGLNELAGLKCDYVVNSVVGMIGLEPTLTALNAGNNVALANKETLVSGGAMVTSLAKKNNKKIIPIDSEHSAIFQCLMGNNDNEISKIILTASGGPFFEYDTKQLKNVTKAQALAHPNWNMGAKITIDSATLMNKGLEFIEAIWLFDIAPEQIEVIIHRQSIIHSAVEFMDGAIIAQLGVPDMRVPIQYALTFPKRYPCPAKKLSLLDVKSFTFDKPDENTFVCLKTAQKAIKYGGNAPAIVNSANEEAVNAFLNDKIKFYDIFELVQGSLENIRHKKDINLDIIYETDIEAREYVRSKLK